MKIIKYQVLTEINYGTEEQPDIRQDLKEKRLLYTETAYEGAVKDAYNGEVTIEDVEDTRPLHEIKSERIEQSKSDLAFYLKSHPLQWTDGEYYSITAEKQQQLTSKLMAATMAQSLSEDYNLTWNSTGEVCKEWTLQDLSALAFAIDSRVTALVSYQQTQEVAMRNAATQEELDAIVVDYDTVPMPEVTA